MIARVITGLGRGAEELGADPADDLLLASRISRQRPFGPTTRSLELE
jgi:hypothetical protein